MVEPLEDRKSVLSKHVKLLSDVEKEKVMADCFSTILAVRFDRFLTSSVLARMSAGMDF